MPAGKISCPSCLDRYLPMSEQVSCSRMEMLHPGDDGNIFKNGTFFVLDQMCFVISSKYNIWKLHITLNIEQHYEWYIIHYCNCNIIHQHWIILMFVRVFPLVPFSIQSIINTTITFFFPIQKSQVEQTTSIMLNEAGWAFTDLINRNIIPLCPWLLNSLRSNC